MTYHMVDERSEVLAALQNLGLADHIGDLANRSAGQLFSAGMEILCQCGYSEGEAEAIIREEMG